LLDIVAWGLLAYAGALVSAARRENIERTRMLAFTVADAAWVAGSVVLLTVYWNELTTLARFLVIAVALAVDLFAMLQFRAAGTLPYVGPRLKSTS
jgi:Na+(H+)/acetate symporter ActP